VDIATLVSLENKVFVGGNTGNDLITLNIGTGSNNATDYNVRMGGGDDTFTLQNTLINSFISLDGETIANDGNDVFTGGVAGDLILNSEIVGRGGNDILGTVALDLNVSGSTVNGNTGLDTIRIGASDSSEIYGGQDQDSIVTTGNQVGMTYNGNKGADTITLGAGTFTGFVNGGQGADTITATLVSNTGAGITMGGDKGADVLVGTGRADSIFGGEDADNITGAAGADSLTGGTGNDIFSGYGTNSVSDVNDGADKGFDTIADFSATTSATTNGDRISTGTAAVAGAFILQGAGGAAVTSDSGADLDEILTTAFAGFTATDTASGVITITAGAANAGIAGNYFVTNNDGLAGFGSGTDNVIKLGSLAGFTAANIANVVIV